MSDDALTPAAGTIRLSGAADICDARELHRAALAALAATGDVVVELAEVETADTAATQVFLALRAALAAQGRRLSIVGARDSVQAAWRALGTDGALLE